MRLYNTKNYISEQNKNYFNIRVKISITSSRKKYYQYLNLIGIRILFGFIFRTYKINLKRHADFFPYLKRTFLIISF